MVKGRQHLRNDDLPKTCEFIRADYDNLPCYFKPKFGAIFVGGQVGKNRALARIQPETPQFAPEFLQWNLELVRELGINRVDISNKVGQALSPTLGNIQWSV